MIRVRTSLPSDLAAIRAVSVRSGLSAFDPDEMLRSWQEHPFRTEFEGVPNGWVLETDGGEIVGTFSNTPMMYELDGRQIRVGVAGSWGVDATHRSASLLLAIAYFNQKGVDICVNGSASAGVSRIMPAMKAGRIPAPDYDLSYLWITGRQAFAAAALRKKKIPAAGVLSRAAALGLWTSDLISGRVARRPANVKRLDGFGPEFDAFWEKLRQGPGRLRAVRTAAMLQWRFGSMLRRERGLVLAWGRGQEMRGYAVLRDFTRKHLGLRQNVIADLQALDDSQQVLADLIAAAQEVTREEGKAALEWQGWSSRKRDVAVSLRPRSYRYPVWPLFYKVVNQELAPTLAAPDVWDFSPLDAF